MSTEKSVKGEIRIGAKVEKAVTTDREYHRPEVHDLGKLDLLEGGIGATSDGNQAYIWRP